MDGCLVVLEGGEGAGKTTLADGIRRAFNQDSEVIHVTREPGGTNPGESIRAILRERLEPWAEVFLFLAARNQLVRQVIRPEIQAGKLVLSDRFTGSTLAYQGYGRGLPLDRLEPLCELAADGLKPALTIYLDLDPTEGLRRKRGEEAPVATGAESLAFHRRVRDGYLALAASQPSWVTIDARLAPADVVHEALRHIRPLVPPSPG